MRVTIANLITTQQILVGVPDDLEIVNEHGQTYIVRPGTGVTSPRILMSTTLALNEGLLVRVKETVINLS